MNGAEGRNLKRVPDFLVVRGGINGLLVSRNLLGLGASVVLIDQGEVARKASWAGGGIVSPLISVARFSCRDRVGELGAGILPAPSSAVACRNWH